MRLKSAFFRADFNDFVGNPSVTRSASSIAYENKCSVDAKTGGARPHFAGSAISD